MDGYWTSSRSVYKGYSNTGVRNRQKTGSLIRVDGVSYLGTLLGVSGGQDKVYGLNIEFTMASRAVASLRVGVVNSSRRVSVTPSSIW